MPQSRSACGGDPADRGDLEAGERAGVEAELVELLADGAHGVDRGEPDPLVAAGDHALDGPLELLRRARRLDRDRRDDRGGGAVRARGAPSSSRTAPWCAARGRPSRTAAWSRTTTASRAGRRSDPTTASTGKRPSDMTPAASASVVTVVRCSVLVPRSVTATGVERVAPGGDERLEGDDGLVGLADDDDGDRRVDDRGEVADLAAGGEDVDPRGGGRGQRDARVRRHGRDRR